MENPAAWECPPSDVKRSAAAVETRVQVDRRDAARRSLAGLVPRRDQQRGTVEALGDLCGDDADDAGVPPRVGEDQGAVAEHPRRALDEPDRLFADLGLDLPPPQIQTLEQVGELAGVAQVVREKEFDGSVGAIEAAGGVDPRTHAEADLGGAQRAFFDPGRFQQRPHAGARAGAEQLETVVDQNPVFAEQRRDVGHRAEGHEVEVGEQPLVVPRVRTGSDESRQGLGELEGDADAGEALEGVGAPGAPGVEHRVGGGQDGRGFVMVGDDDVDAQGAGLADFGGARNAAIDRDDQRDAGVGVSTDRRHVESVAVVDAVRNVVADVGRVPAQEIHQQRGAGDPVDIVVAPDQDAPPLAHRERNGVDRVRHAAHPERVVQTRERGVQKGPAPHPGRRRRGWREPWPASRTHPVQPRAGRRRRPGAEEDSTSSCSLSQHLIAMNVPARRVRVKEPLRRDRCG